MLRKISAFYLLVFNFISFIERNLTTILISSSLSSLPTIGSIEKISCAFFLIVKSYLIGYWP
jgi:hypothetical protein